MPDDIRRDNLLERFLGPGVPFFKVMSLLAVPMTVALLAALFLAVPEQTREIYRVFARDLARADTPGGVTWHRLVPGQIEFGLGMMFLASFFNWLLARNLTLRFADADLATAGYLGWTLRWLPRICGALIPFGAGAGLILAGLETRGLPMTAGPAGAPSAAENDVPLVLFATAGCVILFGVLLIAFTWWRTWGSRRQKYVRSRGWLYTPAASAGFALMMLASVIVFAPPLTGESSTKLAQLVGTPAIFCWFVLLVAYFGSLLSYWRVRTGVPFIGLLAVYAIAIAWWDVNDNHRVTAVASEPAKAQLDLRSAFRAWYEAREDRSAYEQALGGRRPYPVFIVSAAGGGLYAAEFTATALGRIQDDCPGFAQHVFAISGVSGGGMGAALFTRLIQDEAQVKTADLQGLDPCNLRIARAATAKGFEQRARDYLGADFLAPIAGAALFPDLLQRFLFFPVRAFDRARAFEASLDARWQRVHPDCGESCRPFAQAFLGHWRPGGHSPALVLNATDVDLGYRVVMAPFVIGGTVPDEYNALRNFHRTTEGRDVSLATAVGLSARFPWVLPHGSLEVADEKVADETGTARRRTMRLVDGGIFENSGVDTVMDVLFELRDLETPPEQRPPALRNEPWIVIHPIVISGYRLNASTGNTNFRGEAMSPVAAMLSARVQRANLASYRMFRERGYHCGRADQAEICRSAGGVRFLVLNHEDYRLPLGWQLSTFSRDVIRAHIGTARSCRPIGRIRDMFVGGRREQRQLDTIAENDCTACAVRSVLRTLSVAEVNGCR